jgi:anti-anti-sigma factor
VTATPPFHCEIDRAEGEARVRPVGELDIATAPEVDRHLRELREGGGEALVLDLRAVAFMDSSGLRLIVSWDEEARRDGFGFALVAGADVVERVFDTTRVREHLTFVEPRHTA